MAMELVGQEVVDQLGQKAPMYTYAAAKIAVANTEEDLFKANMATKSVDDIQMQAYENIVRGRINAPINGQRK